MQIDQNGTGWTEAQLAKDLTAGTKFVVLSGGNGTLYSSATYEVTSGEEPKKVLVGDADGDSSITAQDASEVAKSAVGKSSALDDSEINWYAGAYSDGDAEVTAQDASEIAKNAVGKTTDFVGKTVDIGTYGTKSVN